MNARQNHQQMTSLSQMALETDSPLYWVDKSSPGPRANQIINSLPLKLPEGDIYQLSLSGNTLTITGTQAGISSYKITQSTYVRGIEGSREGTLILIDGGYGIRQILLQSHPQPLPRHAVNHGSLAAPLNLLDEYAQLRTQEQIRELSRAEQRRKMELLGEIGTEYQKLQRESAASSEYSPYTSTPSSSGESRSGGSANKAG